MRKESFRVLLLCGLRFGICCEDMLSKWTLLFVCNHGVTVPLQVRFRLLVACSVGLVCGICILNAAITLKGVEIVTHFTSYTYIPSLIPEACAKSLVYSIDSLGGEIH